MSAFHTEPQSFRGGDALARLVSAVEEMARDHALRRRRRRARRLISGLSEFQREDLGLHELMLAQAKRAGRPTPAKPGDASAIEELIPYPGGLGRRKLETSKAPGAAGPAKPQAGAADAERLAPYLGGLGRR